MESCVILRKMKATTIVPRNINMDDENGTMEFEQLQDFVIHQQNSWKITKKELMKKYITSAAQSVVPSVR